MPIGTNTPNPQNGSGNPYNPQTYTYNGTNAVGGSTYNIGTGITGLGTVTLTKADADRFVISTPSRSVMEMQWVDDTMQYVFTGEENNATIKMALNPETDMKPIELFQLNALINACVNRICNCEGVMRFVRHHNLERHFSFTVV